MEQNQELRNKPMRNRSTNISQGSQEYLVGKDSSINGIG